MKIRLDEIEQGLISSADEFIYPYHLMVEELKKHYNWKHIPKFQPSASQVEYAKDIG